MIKIKGRQNTERNKESLPFATNVNKLTLFHLLSWDIRRCHTVTQVSSHSVVTVTKQLTANINTTVTFVWGVICCCAPF